MTAINTAAVIVKMAAKQSARICESVLVTSGASQLIVDAGVGVGAVACADVGFGVGVGVDDGVGAAVTAAAAGAAVVAAYANCGLVSQ